MSPEGIRHRITDIMEYDAFLAVSVVRSFVY